MELHWRSTRLTGRRRQAAAVLLAAVLAGLTACGGGSDFDPTPPGEARDDDKALTANLRLTDFPPGWQRQNAPLRSPDSPEDVRFSECMGRPPAAGLRTAVSDSDNFSTGEFTRANSSVQVMRTDVIAQEDMAALRGERAIPCLRERLNTELAAQNPPGGPPFELTSVDRFDPPVVGDDTLGFRVIVAAPSLGRDATLYVDQVFVRLGRIEISTSFVEPGKPFATDLEQTLVRQLVERAR